jgi:hypothetical protein
MFSGNFTLNQFGTLKEMFSGNFTLNQFATLKEMFSGNFTLNQFGTLKEIFSGNFTLKITTNHSIRREVWIALSAYYLMLYFI